MRITNKVIGVDVDCTVLPSGEYWWEWMNCMTQQYKPFPTTAPIEYDLSIYFKKELEEAGIDPMSFWRTTGAYDMFVPDMSAVCALSKLSKENKIVFVSHVKGFCTKSKFMFLERFFPFMSGVIWTQEKNFAAVDYLVDDRINNLNLMSEDCECILFDTPYTQAQPPKRVMQKMTCWEEISDHFVYGFSP